VSSYLGAPASQAAMLLLTGRPGDWCNRSDSGARWDITGTDPTQLSNWTQTSYAAPVPRVTTTTSSSTPTPSAATDDEYALTALAAAATFAAPTGSPAHGQHLIIRVKDNGTARTLAWNAIYRAMGVTLPSTTVISKTLYVAMIYNSTDVKWDVLGIAQEG
jgi:hypothetical protein